MKKILICLLLCLAGCAKQDVAVEEIKAEPFIKQSITSDKPAYLNFAQLVDITKNRFPDYSLSYKKDEHLTQFLAKGLSPDFQKFNNWMSIKVSENGKDWDSFTVEIYDNQSYETAKFMTFQTCKEVWKNIDDRVPAVIDELAQRIVSYEHENSKAVTQHIRYGYYFHLDATNYQDGYPVVCQISYDKIPA